MEHVGIEVHQVEFQICILTENGDIVEQRSRMQRRDSLFLGGRPTTRASGQRGVSGR